MAKQILDLSTFTERPGLRIEVKQADGTSVYQTCELYNGDEMSVVDGALLRKWIDEMEEIEGALKDGVSDPPTDEQQKLADRHLELARKFVAKVAVDLPTDTLMKLKADRLAAIVVHFLGLPQRAQVAEAIQALSKRALQSTKSIGENSSPS
jgi:hypothetical protein